MTPQFTPLQSDGRPEAAPRFRGKWGTAANSVHRNRFSASEKYGVNGYESMTQMLESDTNVGVTTMAKTTVDAAGYTAIRVNLPPIGFNKARIKIVIEDTEDVIDLIDLEVPAVIVIDPGHGGEEPRTEAAKKAAGYIFSDIRGEWTLGGSATNHAVAKPSGIKEKEMTLEFANMLLDSLGKLKNQNKLLIKIYTTRKEDKNLSLEDRGYIAKKHGADIYNCIHFNGNEKGKQVTGTESHAFKGNDPNYNYQEDFDLGLMVAKAAASVMKGNNRGVFGTPLDAINDKYLGNFNGYTPCRATLWEGEFIDVPKIDELLNTGENHYKMRKDIVSAIADTNIRNLFQQKQ
jgi:N-acetylmuramoyl-L-alanine amidase